MLDSYLPVDQLCATDSSIAAPGTLVYLPYGKSYSLWGEDLDDSRLLLDLGGEKPLLVWAIKEDGLGAAIRIDGWRLEVDPASACSVENQQLPWGHAFIAPGGAGIVGRYGTGRQPLMPMHVNGSIFRGSSSSARGAFRSWRIVAGANDMRAVLVDSASFTFGATE